MTRILIVEDQPDLARGISEHLEAQGHTTSIAPTASQAIATVRQERPDLVILDLMLPDRPGDQVLRTIRRGGYAGPVMILSARGDEASKLRGFRAGADDYVTKPFSLLLFLARIDSLLRRVPVRSTPNVVTLDGGRISLDLAARRVLVDGTEVHLRPREFDLLIALQRRQGEAASRRDLLAEVWRYGPGAETRTIDVHVRELRRKLEREPNRPTLIETVRTVGYRLNGSPDRSP